MSERRTWPIRLSPFLRDLALTAATSLLTIAALLVFGRILAARLDPDGFGAVMLARRIVATLDPLSTFAMVIAVTRFAALRGGADRHRVLVAGTAIALGAGAIIGAIWFGLAGAIADVVFESPDYLAIVRATAAVIATYSVFIVVYAWYRGTDRMWQANLWQVWAIAIGPVVVVWLAARPGNEAQLLLGLALVLLVATVPLGVELAVALRKPRPFERETLRTIARYAAPRVPGGLAFGALLAIGPLMAPRLASVEAIGYVATGQALLRVVEGATEAFGRVALAKVSQLVAAGEHLVLKERIADVTAVVLHIGAFATLQLWVWTPEIIGAWLGLEYLPGVGVVRIIVLSVLPYLLFVTLRSVLDSIEERAVNSSNLYIAVAVTLIASVMLGRRFEAEGLAAAMAAGFLLLGVMTFRAVRQRYAFALQTLMVPHVLALNAALFLAALAVQAAVASRSLPVVATAVAAEGVFALLYGFVLWRLGARWMREIARRVEMGAA